VPPSAAVTVSYLDVVMAPDRRRDACHRYEAGPTGTDRYRCPP
jgi:hypothetical protein